MVESKKGSNFDPFFDDFSNKTFHILIAVGESTFIIYSLFFIICFINDAPHPHRARGRERFLLESLL
jgi:hypothetical protein